MVSILLRPPEGACHRLVDSPCFIDAVILSFSANAQCEFSGYMKASVFSWLINIALWCAVKGPATIVVNLWIHLFCCLQAWMATRSGVWSGLCSYFLTATAGGAHAKTGVKSILLNSNPVWDPLTVSYPNAFTRFIGSIWVGLSKSVR